MNSAKSDTWTKEDIERAKIGNRGFSTTKYVRGSILGSGGWSVVYKTQRVTDGMLFAGKSSEVMKELNKEVEMLKSLQHVSFTKPRHTALSSCLLTSPGSHHQVHRVTPRSRQPSIHAAPDGTLSPWHTPIPNRPCISPHGTQRNPLCDVANCPGSRIHARPKAVSL